MPAQYIRIAAPAGLMSVVDNLLLFRCVQIVRRLTQRHRDVGVFCNNFRSHAPDSEFFPQFLRLYASPSRSRGADHFRILARVRFGGGLIGRGQSALSANLGFGFHGSAPSFDLDFARLNGSDSIS